MLFTKAARPKCLYKEGTTSMPLAFLLCVILASRTSNRLELLSTLGRFSLHCNFSQPPRALYKRVVVTTNFFYLKCKDAQIFCFFEKKIPASQTSWVQKLTKIISCQNEHRLQLSEHRAFLPVLNLW